MFKKKPEGYRELLVYKKSELLQREIQILVALFPKTKTFIDLADQISRSARSVTKNIIEGWKRNSTKEYFDFLGFSIGSNSEMLEDLGDIVTGMYKDLSKIKGVMGEKGVMGRSELDKILFYPLNPSFPLAVELFLKAKEVNFLLYKLQKSLESKMNLEGTKPQKQKIIENMRQEKQANIEFQKYLKSIGLKRLEDGRYIQEEKGE